MKNMLKTNTIKTDLTMFHNCYELCIEVPLTNTGTLSEVWHLDN